MARPESAPKTPLGKRLRAVRGHFGDEDRELFAKRLGISRAALAYYERGERVPDSNVIAAYRDKLGVNMNWLVSDEGKMFDLPASGSDAPTPHLKIEAVGPMLKMIGDVVVDVYRDESAKIPNVALVSEIARFYQMMVEEFGAVDEASTRDSLPKLEKRLREEIHEAAAAPGTGKREAS